MALLTSADIGRLAELRSGVVVRIRAEHSNVISAASTTRYYHSGGGSVYPTGYSSAQEGAGTLSPSDIMRLGDLDAVTGKPIDGFSQGHLAIPGYYGDANTKWAAHSPVPWLPTSYLTNPHRGQMGRIMACMPVRFRRARILIPLFSEVSNGLGGALASNRTNRYGSANDNQGGGAASRAQLTFQVGIRKSYTSANSGLTPPEPVLFGGANRYADDVATYPNIWYKRSDPFDFGRMMEENEPWELWPYIQQQGTVASCLPQTFVGGNLQALPNGGKRYDGYSNVAVDSLDAVFSATSIGALYPSTLGGGGTGWAPIVEIEINEQWYPYAAIGTSLIFGDGEGNVGSDGYGDIRGSVNGNRGWLGRAVGDVIGRPYLNIGHSSSRAQYYNKASNWLGVAAILQATTPAVVVNEFSTNDLTNTGNIAWTTLTTWEKHQATYNTNGVYLCTTAGAGATSGTGPSGTGTNIADNVARWEYYGPNTVECRIAAMNVGIKRNLRDLLPSAKLAAPTMLPSSTTSNEYRDAEHQTPRTGYGDETSDWGKYNNNYVRPNLIGYDVIIDLETADITNVFLKQADGTYKLDGKWKPNSSVPWELVASDATHPNGSGAYKISTRVDFKPILGPTELKRYALKTAA